MHHIPSIIKVVSNMYLVNLTNPDKSIWFKDSCIKSLSLKFILFLIINANNVVTVINPNPPICIKVIIINWPKNSNM